MSRKKCISFLYLTIKEATAFLNNELCEVNKRKIAKASVFVDYKLTIIYVSEENTTEVRAIKQEL